MLRPGSSFLRDQEQREDAFAQVLDALLELRAVAETAQVGHGMRALQLRDARSQSSVGSVCPSLVMISMRSIAEPSDDMRAARHGARALPTANTCDGRRSWSPQKALDARAAIDRAQRGVEQLEQDACGAFMASGAAPGAVRS